MIMESVFRKVYDEVICYEEDVREANKAVENEIIYMIEKYKDKLGKEEEEKFLDLLDTAAAFAEYEGFYMGMKYALKGMLMLLKD